MDLLSYSTQSFDIVFSFRSLSLSEELLLREVDCSLALIQQELLVYTCRWSRVECSNFTDG